jgi:hypothetical protein
MIPKAYGPEGSGYGPCKVRTKIEPLVFLLEQSDLTPLKSLTVYINFIIRQSILTNDPCFY